MLEFDVWENQRLSVKDQVYRHDNRLNGDRPAWSTRDGKQGLHREAFLLPDLSWEWTGPWYIADLNGNPIEDSSIEKGGNFPAPKPTYSGISSSSSSAVTNNSDLGLSSPQSQTSSSTTTSAASSGNSKGWLYAPSYLISTKSCSSEPNAFSLVRRRRWVRRAKKSIGGIAMPHPNETILYGFSSAPEAVALCSQNPMAFPVPAIVNYNNQQKGGIAGKASAFFSKMSSSSNSKNTNSTSTVSNSPQTNASFAFSPTTPGGATCDPKSLSSSSIGEVSLLLKHQSTFDSMQSFMAQLFLRTKSAGELISAAADSISPEIYKILRESGIPQTLRAPIWLGFSGALHRKKMNRGKYRLYLEMARKKMQNQNSSINLDVTRTCANHPYFSSGTGPGAKALRNVLFAYQEYAWEKLREKQQQANSNNSNQNEVNLMDMMNKISKKNNNEEAEETIDDPWQQQQSFGSPVSNSTNTTTTAPSPVVAGTTNDDTTSFHDGSSFRRNFHPEDEDVTNNNNEPPCVYHQPLSYICSVFVMTCTEEEDVFWLLTVMVEECSLLQAALNDDEEQHESNNRHPNKMELVVDKFCHDLKARAPPHLQELIGAVDFSISSYGWFQALLTAHVSAPVASRLFDIFLVNVKDSLVFVDFAVALVLKCFLDDNGSALERFIATENGGSGMLDTVSVSKFLNEQMRKVSCDLVL